VITRDTRPMTPDESAEVERLLGDVRESRAVYVFTVLVCIPVLLGFLALLAIFVLPFLKGFSSLERIDVYRFAGTIGLGITLVIGYLAWKGRPRRKAELREDLRVGEVELVHVHAFGARAAPGRIGFFFDVGEGKLLFLRGHYLRAAVAEGRFPNRYFTLVRLPRAQMTLRVECHGDPIEAAPAGEGEGIAWASIPEGTLLPGSLERLTEDVGSLLGR
jgi:hypothetical protein